MFFISACDILPEEHPEEPPEEKAELTTYIPGGWEGPLILSMTKGTFFSSALNNSGMIYADWAIINSSDVDAIGSFYVGIAVDGQLIDSWQIDSLSAGYYIPLQDANLGFLTPGEHTVTLELDPADSISERDESNNIHTIVVNVVDTEEPTGSVPDVVTGTAIQVGTDSVNLTGTVSPNGLTTTYYFEIGYTTAYGSTSSTYNAGSGTVPLSVQLTLPGFLPGTKYYFRVVAENSMGTTYGNDVTFRTKGATDKPLVPIYLLLLSGKK